MHEHTCVHVKAFMLLTPGYLTYVRNLADGRAMEIILFRWTELRTRVLCLNSILACISTPTITPTAAPSMLFHPHLNVIFTLQNSLVLLPGRRM